MGSSEIFFLKFNIQVPNNIQKMPIKPIKEGNSLKINGEVIKSNAGLNEKSGATNEISVSFNAFKIKTIVMAFIIPVIIRCWSK